MPETTKTATPRGEPASLPAQPEWRFLTEAQQDQLAGLVLELAGQLHAERARVLAVEQVLLDAGVTDRAALDRVAAEPSVRQRSAEELDRSLRGLLRVLIEDDDARTPLRPDLEAGA